MQGAAGYPDAVGDQRGGAWQPPGARPGQNEGTENNQLQILSEQTRFLNFSTKMEVRTNERYERKVNFVTIFFYKTPFAEQIIGLLLLCYTSSGCVKMVVFRFRILERSVEMCEQERSASRKSITR